MAGFTKLWSSIVRSTVWQEPLHVKVTWVTMLALSDAGGYVGASIPGLAVAAGVTIEQCEEALQKFLSPDKYSRTQAHEGRRIYHAEGGWVLINYGKFREGRDQEERRIQNRENQRKSRAARKVSSGADSQQSQPASAQAEAEAEAEAISRTTTTSAQKAAPGGEEFSEVWKLYPKRSGGNSRSDALRVFSARVREGVSVGDLRAGVERYAAWCSATGKVGKETVMQATRFFGPGRHWEESWEIPPSNGSGEPSRPTERASNDDTDFVAASTKLLKLVDKRDPMHPHTLTPGGWALLDTKERASLKVIGGIDRVLTAKPNEWQWVVRDFLKAQRGAM